MEPSNNETWLTLSEAAGLLDVHPTTLRRWANNGDIPVMVTPGGHRRFAASDLARFARERSALRNVNGFAGLWATKALARTRQDVSVHRHESWMAYFDEEGRSQTRLLGQQLMGLTLQYLSSESNEENSASILEEARRIGRLYARNCMARGLPLRMTLEASIFFRDSLIETALQLPETANIRPEANIRLLRRVNAILNAVHLAVADVYEHGGDVIPAVE
ncbi:DNA binding domain protein, excisionase family [Candidatus Promineifilum breve]|uniref:DNA binding domain protein, excisionase family n=1 Tax=Candidatus Promineifilum breve TaxID=1806508 RepID=A0A160T783_9CHLR|nr:helix-turn-helix domain-containing protein [Candidatus Promineifilum breve]CUS05168.2 DNA binding domain protein, excisionase family [Candidatus Promineifilum breve]